jgi:hypothetical protein
MLTELDQTGESQISLTDPDSRAMAAHTHVAVGYNVQIAVDSKHKLIFEQQVTNQVVDMGLLAQTAEPAKDVLGVERIAVVADRGYFKIEDIEACEKAGIDPYVPRPQRGPAVRYEPTSDSFLCPAGQRLHPYSSSLMRGLKKINYRNSQACRDCAIRSQCTGNQFRSVSRLENEAVLENAGPHSAAPRHPRQTQRDRRTPIRLDQTMDEPGCVSDARVGEGSRRVQPDRPRLQSPACPQYRGAAKADRRAPSLKATPST